MEEIPCRHAVCGPDQALPSNLNQYLAADRLQAIAKKVGFMQRIRKITPLDFLQGFCLMSLLSDFSLRIGAIIIGTLCGQTLSKQSLWKRIGPKSVQFFRETLSLAIASAGLSSRPLPDGALSMFRRVLIQDSSKLALPDKFVQFYPGARNQTGKQKATLSLQAIYDALGENFVSFSLTPFTRNDQKAAGDIVTVAGRGDLILRDPGYFTTESLCRIDSKGAYFISRLRYGTNLYDLSGDKIDLLQQLRTLGALDRLVLLGAKTRLPARLIATRVPENVANERRRKLRKNRDRRLNPSKAHLALMDWQILLTNVDRATLDPDTICSLYGLRWRIEIIFKSWKSHFSFAKTTDGSREYLESLLYARLIYITLFQTSFFRELQRRIHSFTGRDLSLLKTAQFLAHVAWLFWLGPLTVERMKTVMTQIIVHCTYERRKDRLNYQQILDALLLVPNSCQYAGDVSGSEVLCNPLIL